MRKKNRKGPQDNGFEKKVMETMQTMLKMAELSEIIEAYLNSDNKEEYMLKILEKTKTFENIDKIIMNLILNIPDKTKSIQILHRYTKSFRSTNAMKEAYEIYLILSKEYPNDKLLKQFLKDFKPYA